MAFYRWTSAVQKSIRHCIDRRALLLPARGMRRRRRRSAGGFGQPVSRHYTIPACLRQGKRRLYPAGCIGFPGPFDYDRGICLLKGIGKYDALYGLNFRHLLEGNFSLPFYFFNDAALFVAGACNLTEAKRFQKVFGVCLGTGIGSAFYDRPRLIPAGRWRPARRVHLPSSL